jgi:hypothetical protein
MIVLGPPGFVWRLWQYIQSTWHRATTMLPVSLLLPDSCTADSWYVDYPLAAKNVPFQSAPLSQRGEFQLSDQETWQQEAPSYFAFLPDPRFSQSCGPLTVVLNHVLSQWLPNSLCSPYQSTLSHTVLLSLKVSLFGLNPTLEAIKCCKSFDFRVKRLLKGVIWDPSTTLIKLFEKLQWKSLLLTTSCHSGMTVPSQDLCRSLLLSL